MAKKEEGISAMIRRVAAFVTGGRPMRKIVFAFVDVVSHKPVFIWQDFYGRHWMANTAWAWFRVRPTHGPEIWETRISARGEQL